MPEFKTPILLMIFNRPDTTARVFETLKQLQPSFLYVAADGPRTTAEQAVVDTTRQTVLAHIDWPCQVKTLLRDHNVGVKEAGIGNLNWFFSQVEQGIILEDDCLPDQSFFYFCQELLAKYQDDRRIMHISGNCFQPQPIGQASYYFSHIPHIWGWATWRRAWQAYDVSMADFPAFKQQNKITKLFSSRSTQQFWLEVFAKNYQQEDNGWDFQWTYALMNHDGLAITPNVNLVSNIGFGAEATHATNGANKFGNLPTQALATIKHPALITADRQADNFTCRHNFGAAWPLYPLKKILKKLGLFALIKKLYYLKG